MGMRKEKELREAIWGETAKIKAQLRGSMKTVFGRNVLKYIHI